MIDLFSWNIEYGEHYKFFLGLKRRGRSSPIDSMPKQDFSYHFYRSAYSMLRLSSNQNGMIPLSEILCYTDHFTIIHTKEEFVDIIRGLESEERRHHKEKEDQKKKNKDKSNKSQSFKSRKKR